MAILNEVLRVRTLLWTFGWIGKEGDFNPVEWNGHETPESSTLPSNAFCHCVSQGKKSLNFLVLVTQSENRSSNFSLINTYYTILGRFWYALSSKIWISSLESIWGVKPVNWSRTFEITSKNKNFIYESGILIMPDSQVLFHPVLITSLEGPKYC